MRASTSRSAARNAAELAGCFAALDARLGAQEDTILAELAAVQGQPVDLGGYYRPDHERAVATMRPSATLNAAVDELR